MNIWKLSTIVLVAVLAGFLLAHTGFGVVAAQGGATAKVQLDTSNCGFGVGQDYEVPQGSLVVQVASDSLGNQMYVYDVCR